MAQRRGVGVKPQYTEGKMSDQRVAWVETHVGQFVILAYDNDDFGPKTDKSQPEPGGTIRLMYPKNGRPIFWNLTALRHDELVQLRELLNLALDLAEPVVKLRDKAADDAFERGDDSFSRVYRRTSQLVKRAGAFTEDGKSLLNRSNDVPSGPPGDGDPEGDLRDGGEAVAEPEPQDARLQDDDSAEY